MATVAFIASSVLFLLGMAVFLTVFLLVAHAVTLAVKDGMPEGIVVRRKPGKG